MIIERTLSLLYSAQQHPHSSPILEHENQSQEAPQTMTPPSNQQSLHRFFNISSKPTAPTTSMPQLERPSNCDDCGTSLDTGNGDEMEIDDLAPEDHACGACGRAVCFSCSVSNLGEQKRCLRCVGRKDHVGGVGWSNGHVTVC